MRGPILTLLLGTPGVALLSLVFRRRERLVRRFQAGSAVALVLVSLTPLVLPTEPFTLNYEWIPGMGQAKFSLSAGVAPLVAATYALLLADLWRRTDLPPPGERTFPRRLLSVLVVWSTMIALTVSHFIVRYVAIELASLCSVLLIVLNGASPPRPRALVRTYLLLRVGDVALLASILVLALQSGTYQIIGAIAGAEHAPPTLRIVLILSGTLAAWVKLGLPPTHGWLVQSETLAPPERLLVRCAGLPLLGGYYLARIRPLTSSLARGAPVGLLGVAACIWLIFAARRWSTKVTPSTWSLLLHGCLAPIASWAGLSSLYMISFVPARVVIALVTERSGASTWAKWAPRAAYAPNPILSAQRSERAHQDLPLRACGLSRAVENLLVSLDSALARQTLRASGWTQQSIEKRLDNGVTLAANWTHRVSATLQTRHVGRLRYNLRWAVLGVVGLVVTALIVGARLGG